MLIYVAMQDLTLNDIAIVEDPTDYSFWMESTMNPIPLLRTLLARGVSSFCFSKRWRVSYGPHRTRSPHTKLSVPYRAKDNPSTRSKFSHLEVSIIFTSLHCYYAGLEDDDFVLAFKHLLDSDNTTIEYEAWVQKALSKRSEQEFGCEKGREKHRHSRTTWLVQCAGHLIVWFSDVSLLHFLLCFASFCFACSLLLWIYKYPSDLLRWRMILTPEEAYAIYIYITC